MKSKTSRDNEMIMSPQPSSYILYTPSQLEEYVKRRKQENPPVNYDTVRKVEASVFTHQVKRVLVDDDTACDWNKACRKVLALQGGPDYSLTILSRRYAQLKHLLSKHTLSDRQVRRLTRRVFTPLELRMLGKPDYAVESVFVFRFEALRETGAIW